MTESKMSLSCNLSAMTPTQRARYEDQKQRLRAALAQAVEMPAGYQFHFADEPGLLLTIAEFVDNERRCCPFYTFQIELAAGGSAISLRVTGPAEARDFIRDALGSPAALPDGRY